MRGRERAAGGLAHVVHQPQPGQQQYGQPGYAPAGPSAGQQFGAAAQQFGAAANSAFNQFQTAVVAETGKVSGRSVRATYSLIGIAASAVLILVSMLLPYLSSEYGSASMFTVKGGYSAFHLVLLMTVVGLGAAYWFTNQKWAYLSAGIGALVVALLGVIQFIVRSIMTTSTRALARSCWGCSLSRLASRAASRFPRLVSLSSASRLSLASSRASSPSWATNPTALSVLRRDALRA